MFARFPKSKSVRNTIRQRPTFSKPRLELLEDRHLLSTTINVDHLSPPAVYDNAEASRDYGQTFIARTNSVAGGQIYTQNA
jgi:hypothetical protein